MDEAVAALAATEFEGSWEFTFLFTQGELGWSAFVGLGGFEYFGFPCFLS